MAVSNHVMMVTLLSWRGAVLQGRVPRPGELEIQVLAYAPHFLGFAAAHAASSASPSPSPSPSPSASPSPRPRSLTATHRAAGPIPGPASPAPASLQNPGDIGGQGTSAMSNGVAASGAGVRDGAGSGRRYGTEEAVGGGGWGARVMVPTGLSARSEWPDEGLRRRQQEEGLRAAASPDEVSTARTMVRGGGRWKIGTR